MARPQHEVKMDYKNATRSASDLDDIVRKLEQQKHRLEECISSIYSWQSEASRIYKGKIRRQIDRINEVIRILKDTSRVVREVARNTYNADMDAIRMANGQG